MPNTSQSKPADYLGVSPGGECHRSGNRSESDGEYLRVSKGLGNDLLDGAYVSDQSAEGRGQRQRIPARKWLLRGGGDRAANLFQIEASAILRMQGLWQTEP